MRCRVAPLPERMRFVPAFGTTAGLLLSALSDNALAALSASLTVKSIPCT